MHAEIFVVVRNFDNSGKKILAMVIFGITQLWRLFAQSTLCTYTICSCYYAVT